MADFSLIQAVGKKIDIGSYAAPYSTYSPVDSRQSTDSRQLHYSPQSDYSAVINSPGTVIQTKKEAISEMQSTQKPRQDIRPSISGGAKSAQGIPAWMLIAGAAVVGIMVLK